MSVTAFRVSGYILTVPVLFNELVCSILPIYRIPYIFIEPFVREVFYHVHYIVHLYG